MRMVSQTTSPRLSLSNPHRCITSPAAARCGLAGLCLGGSRVSVLCMRRVWNHSLVASIALASVHIFAGERLSPPSLWRDVTVAKSVWDPSFVAAIALASVHIVRRRAPLPDVALRRGVTGAKTAPTARGRLNTTHGCASLKPPEKVALAEEPCLLTVPDSVLSSLFDRPSRAWGNARWSTLGLRMRSRAPSCSTR